MLRLTLLRVGNMGEIFYRDGMEEYYRRLGPYARVQIITVSDQPLRGDGAAAASAEGERLLRELDRLAPALTVALDIGGRSMSSPELAAFLERQAVSGASHICFVVGGTAGLSPAVLSRAGLRWSLSSLTFPHQMVPLIVLEQLYRAFRIIRNEPYHR